MVQLAFEVAQLAHHPMGVIPTILVLEISQYALKE